MDGNQIPIFKPSGETGSTIWTIVSIAAYLLILGGLIAYLLWKLPKAGKQQERPAQKGDRGKSRT
jgi:hypothetical protein